MNTFKSSVQHVAAAIGLIAAVTVGGCVMIPYDTPESKAQIQRDLKIAPSDIQAVSETNWCLSHMEAKAAAGPLKAWEC